MGPAALSRRRLLQVSASGLALGAIGGGALALGRDDEASAPDRIGPSSPEVLAAERARTTTGRVTRRHLVAQPVTLDLGGRTARTWAFGDGTPAPEIRLTAGDQLEARVENRLPSPTSVHWHGLALRNDMDGVPGVTTPALAPGGEGTYRFRCPDPGTYWFHPHVGVQLDTAMMGALVVEDPHEPLGYDDDVTLVLDDWTDGVGASPDTILRRLTDDGMASMSSGSMSAGAGGAVSATGSGITRSTPLGDDTGDVSYPLHLVNGRPHDDPFVVRARPGARIRLRLVNGGSDTAYRVAVGGHRLTVVHADGYPVEPVEVDTVLLGMGERYDVLVDVRDGAFPILSSPEGKAGRPALAVLRTSGGRTPLARAPELERRLLGYGDLRPTTSAAMPARTPDRTLSVDLTMQDGGRRWLINGRAYPDDAPLDVRTGERVRLVMTNRTTMFHPMHLHGHTFALVQAGRAGMRKDTIDVLPMQRLSVDVEADNPGQWLLHCHNAYHGEQGMMTLLSYVR